MGSAGVITLGHLPERDFLQFRAGLKAGLLLSACPHRVGLIPIKALKKYKSLSPPIPVGGGVVNTNDCCISFLNMTHLHRVLHSGKTMNSGKTMSSGKTMNSGKTRRVTLFDDK